MSPSWFKWWGSIPSRWLVSNIFSMLIVFRDGPEWECKWAQLIISKLLTCCQDREICCYSISCKEKENIDITLKVGKLNFFFEVCQTSITSISVADVTQQVRENITRGRGEYLRVEKKVSSKIIIDLRLKRQLQSNCNLNLKALFVICTLKLAAKNKLWSKYYKPPDLPNDERNQPGTCETHLKLFFWIVLPWDIVRNRV